MRKDEGLYRQQFEHDNCGIGAVVNSKGVKSHKTVENALKIVENLEHRAGKDAEGKTGDGVGILLQISCGEGGAGVSGIPQSACMFPGPGSQGTGVHAEYSAGIY